MAWLKPFFSGRELLFIGEPNPCSVCAMDIVACDTWAIPIAISTASRYGTRWKPPTNFHIMGFEAIVSCELMAYYIG